ncbi:MAG: hypothetical protein EOP10_13390 [Proteobacteria bacterium]|nr:MAG: hypothetical protein EOP10_13390 [Pseudomonadota bacterium]
MSNRWFRNLLLSLMLLSLPAHAQTFEDGYQSYVRNQFPVAELQFKNALKKVSSDEEKAYILKFIGICQYMRGDKKNAASSMSQSVSYDRSIQIDTEEVLDPSVVTFFNGVKSRVPPEPKKKPKPAAVVEAPRQESAFQANPSPKKKSKKKKKSESSLSLAHEPQFDDKPSRIGVLHFLPFGAPQFANGSYLLGSGIAALQIYSIYSVLDADKVAKDRQGLNSVVRTKDGLTEDQRNAFYKENNDYIDELKKQKNYAIAGFGALWVISVAEGIINNRSSSSKSSEAPPESSVSPIIQANRHGGGFGVSWQKSLK